MADALLDRNQLQNLLEATLQVPGLSDPDVRDSLVQDTERRLRRPLDATRFAEPRHDLSSLLSAAASCTGGLRALAAALLDQHAGPPATTAAVLIEERAGAASELAPPDREALRTQLAGIPVGQIADAVDGLVDAGGLGNLQTWRDLPAAILVLEALPVPDDGVPQLLTFTERLARVVGGVRGDGLRRWVETVAAGLGVDEPAAAELRAAGRVSPTRPGTSAPSQRSGPPDEEHRTRRADDSTTMIWGGVPIRNRNFSGRVALLDRLGDALRRSSKASVLPQTLHGMGGVGKTQLVIEYVYRHQHEYDLVWWIAAEQTPSVLASLSQLAERLGLPATEDRQQTARTVLDALAGAELTWLLVYDNADDPDALDQYVPSTGGHVIVTTRNQEWSTVGQPIAVDVFSRPESIELLQRRSRDEGNTPRIHTAEADLLADKLGDLPLALEQAVSWYLATAMPIEEYIELLDSHVKDLLSEGKPANYPLTVAAFVTFAVEQLRETSPGAAQLFELFAYLGGEPVAVSLLRMGKDAELTEPLRGLLAAPIQTNRTVRELNRYGLAKVDALQRVQVHRLVQRVLRDSLAPTLAEQTLRNAQRLISQASPGDPDEHTEFGRLGDLGPHIDPADLVHAADLPARRVVVDYARYLWVTGDYENSLALARRAAEVWEVDTFDPQVGRDGSLTLVARGHMANAMRTLGRSRDAAGIARDAYDRMSASPAIGPDHEFTLITGNQVGADLRIAGDYVEALTFDRASVASHTDVFGAGDTYTLRAQANLAVDLRMVGSFAEAYELDEEIAAHWEDVGISDPRALAAYINLARDCYGMGAYRRGLELLEQWQAPLLVSRGPGHSQVLLAGRTHAILLRKSGRLTEAEEVIRENEERVHKRFGPGHEFALAASVSHANALRELGQHDAAGELIARCLVSYDKDFGTDHPLTLVARVNQAITYRALGQLSLARDLDERCYAQLADVLAPDHPYTVCAGVGLATDLALAGEHAEAVTLSRQMLEVSRATSGGGHDARDGAEHPYLLQRAINLSHDLRATGEMAEAEELFTSSLVGLRDQLGSEHPDVVAIESGARVEGDIEPPPT